MALEDLAMMRAIAGSSVLYASDAVCAEKLVEQMATHKGICFLRTSRPKTPVLYGNDEQFPIGGAKVLRQSSGDKVTVVAAGVTLYEALKAADALKGEGIGITVIDVYSIKPLGKDVIQATLADGVSELEVNTIFGGVTLIVPADWKVQLKMTSIMGGFSDKRSYVKENSDPSRVLIIKGSTIFGGGELKSY